MLLNQSNTEVFAASRGHPNNITVEESQTNERSMIINLGRAEDSPAWWDPNKGESGNQELAYMHLNYYNTIDNSRQ